MERLRDTGRISTLIRALEPVLPAYLGAGDRAGFSSLGARLADARPKVMLFGVYNAGKSTLLNALRGGRDAAMSDVPQTDCITEYDWCGHGLLDSPGVDAPLEHEEITLAQLASCDVVLMVVPSNGPAEERQTWEMGASLLARGRCLMVILTDHDGLLQDPESMALRMTRVRELLVLAARRQGVEGRAAAVPVQVVNARTALRAREEGAAALLQASGLPLLESQLAVFLRDSASYAVQDACMADLARMLDTGREALARAMDDPAAEAHAQLRTRIGQERARLLEALSAAIPDLRQVLETRARSVFVNGMGGQVADTAFRSMLQDLEVLAGDRMSSILMCELECTRNRLSGWGQLGDARFASRSFDSASRGQTDQDAYIQALLGRFDTFVGPDSRLTAWLKEWVLKRFGNNAGPLFEVFSVLFGLFIAADAEARQQASAIARVRAMGELVRNSVNALVDHYRFQIAGIIDQFFAPMERQLDEETARLTGRHMARAADLAVLDDAVRVLCELREGQGVQL